jgi:hypothetical protein
VAITAHYVGTPGLHLSSINDVYRLVRQIQSGDMDGKGYSDIMYNVAINPFEPGVIELRGVGVRGAANGSADSNRISPSVLFFQGPDTAETSLIEAAGAQYADQLFEDFAGRQLPWVPHNRWRSTSCPGPAIERHLALFDGRELILPPVFNPGPLQDRPTLSLGGRDTEGDGYVHYAQRVVNAASIPLGVDGVFGESTLWAVMAFQDRFGVPMAPDAWIRDEPGQVGLLTWAKIEEVAQFLGVR